MRKNEVKIYLLYIYILYKYEKNYTLWVNNTMICKQILYYINTIGTQRELIVYYALFAQLTNERKNDNMFLH